MAAACKGKILSSGALNTRMLLMGWGGGDGVGWRGGFVSALSTFTFILHIGFASEKTN